MRPDVVGIDKTFDYLVPDGEQDVVGVGSEVRLDLNGRRVGGWVVATDVDPPTGVKLRSLAKVRGWGPSAELIELAEWAAWRWAGRLPTFLRAASPPAAVRGLPRPPGSPPPEVVVPGTPLDRLVTDALRPSVAVVRWPPASEALPLVVAAANDGLRAGPDGRSSVLVLSPSVAQSRHLGLRLRRAGFPVAIVADDRPGAATAGEWARAAAGGCMVVGARAAAWAPAPGLSLAVVLDEHDESYQEERAPTWHARDVLVERARRAGARCLLVSPCPTLEALAAGTVIAPARAEERAGWPVTDVVDRRREDVAIARSLISPALAAVLRTGARVVCVLNRTGRARLSACAACGELARCESCGAAVSTDDEGLLRCGRCGAMRPLVCSACGSTKLKVLRPGVSRVREELEAMVGEPVAELTATSSAETREMPTTTRVVVGTEAALHRVEWAEVVAFLDFDQELAAPRYRAAEQALALLARAGRLVGGRRASGRIAGETPGRVLVQTRLPDHVVLRAALHGDPGLVAAAERPLREALRFPPVAALAQISGAAAPVFVERLEVTGGVELLGPVDGTWLARAGDHRLLCDALATVPRPPGRLRIEVDPLRI